MKNKAKILVLAVCMLIAPLCVSASAVPSNFTFSFQLIDVVEDTANAGLEGKPTWYQWIYRVDVVEGGDSHNGFSHFTIGLEECINGHLAEAIEGTAGANGVFPNDDNLLNLEGNEYREYEPATIGVDGSTSLYGIKWNLEEGFDFDEIGDFDYFWFSAPTNQGILNNSLVKHAGNLAEGDLLTPVCPDCKDPVVPEPTTMLLFGAGAVGTILRRKKIS